MKFCYNNHFSFTWSNIGMIESICLSLWTALSNSIWNQLICKLTSLTPNNSFLFIRVYPFMILSYSFREWGYFSGLFEAKCLLLPLFAPCCLALDDRCITNESAREQRTSSYTFHWFKNVIDSVSGLWWLTSLTLPQTLFLSLFTTRFLLLPLFIPSASFPHLQLHAPTPGCLFSFPRPLPFISVRFTETCRIRLHIFIAPSRFAQLFRLKVRFNWWRWTQTFSPTSLFLRIVLQSRMKRDTGREKNEYKAACVFAVFT